MMKAKADLCDGLRRSGSRQTFFALLCMYNILFMVHYAEIVVKLFRFLIEVEDQILAPQYFLQVLSLGERIIFLHNHNS